MQQERRNQGSWLVWLRVARKLLKTGYGIQPAEGIDTHDQWEAWYGLLGTPTNEQVRGPSLLRAMSATGMLGLLALAIAPSLRQWEYIALSVGLVSFGLYVDIRNAKWWGDPAFARVMKTSWMLTELSRIRSEGYRNRPDRAEEGNKEDEGEDG